MKGREGKGMKGKSLLCNGPKKKDRDLQTVVECRDPTLIAWGREGEGKGKKNMLLTCRGSGMRGKEGEEITGGGDMER